MAATDKSTVDAINGSFAGSPAGIASATLALQEMVSSQLIIGIASALVLVKLLFDRYSEYGKPPLVNQARHSLLDVFGNKQKLDFAQNPLKHLDAGRQRYPARPFRVTTDMGFITVLPIEFAYDIRNNKLLSVNEVLKVDNFAELPGFEPTANGFADDGLLLAVVRKHLAKHLDDLNRPISIETGYVLQKTFGTPTEWREIKLKEALADIVVGGLACAFIGTEHSRNEAWLRVSKDYLMKSVQASKDLRLYPKPLLRIVHWFLPSCKELRGMVAEARQIMAPIVEDRRAGRRRGEKTEYPNSIDWFEDEAAGRPYDPAPLQLLISLAGIHATSDLVNETLLHLAQDPALLAELRAEIVAVLPRHGFTKAGLYNMMLLDSVVREALRIRTDPVQMNRIVMGNILLPDGTLLRRGERICVDAGGMNSASVYPEPLRFDGRRFLRMRSDPSQADNAPLTAAGLSFLAWGYGPHTCPGRFFVANMIKVAVVHIVMKYDFKLPEGYTPELKRFGINCVSDPASRLLVRKRVCEIDLDAVV